MERLCSPSVQCAAGSLRGAVPFRPIFTTAAASPRSPCWCAVSHWLGFATLPEVCGLVTRLRVASGALAQRGGECRHRAASTRAGGLA